MDVPIGLLNPPPLSTLSSLPFLASFHLSCSSVLHSVSPLQIPHSSSFSFSLSSSVFESLCSSHGLFFLTCLPFPSAFAIYTSCSLPSRSLQKLARDKEAELDRNVTSVSVHKFPLSVFSPHTHISLISPPTHLQICSFFPPLLAGTHLYVLLSCMAIALLPKSRYLRGLLVFYSHQTVLLSQTHLCISPPLTCVDCRQLFLQLVPGVVTAQEVSLEMSCLLAHTLMGVALLG